MQLRGRSEQRLEDSKELQATEMRSIALRWDQRQAASNPLELPVRKVQRKRAELTLHLVFTVTTYHKQTRHSAQHLAFPGMCLENDKKIGEQFKRPREHKKPKGAPELAAPSLHCALLLATASPPFGSLPCCLQMHHQTSAQLLQGASHFYHLNSGVHPSETKPIIPN